MQLLMESQNSGAKVRILPSESVGGVIISFIVLPTRRHTLCTAALRLAKNFEKLPFLNLVAFGTHS